jgi:hypothetical protein
MLNTWLVARSEAVPALLLYECGIQRLVDWNIVTGVSKYLVPSIFRRVQNVVNRKVFWLQLQVRRQTEFHGIFVHVIRDVTNCCKHDRLLTRNKKTTNVANVHQPDELQRISRTHGYRMCIKPMSLSDVLPTTSPCRLRIKCAYRLGTE